MTKKIHDYIYSMRDGFLRDLSELIAVPSVIGIPEDGAPFGIEPKNALLKMREICENMGFRTTDYENAVLCADYIPEFACGEIELGILAHLDVVPVEKSNWDTDPFSLTEKNGVLYGRGVIDDKGPAIAALYALKCVKELGIPLKKGVRLIFGTNEENGSEDLEIYKKRDKFPPNVFTPDGSFPVINIEKGMMRSSFNGTLSGQGSVVSICGGRIPNAVPDTAKAELRFVSLEAVLREIEADKSGAAFEARESGGNVEILCRGRAAHASTPESGINAVTAVISLVNRLFVSGALPSQDGKQRAVLSALEKIFPFGETNGDSLGLRCSDESGSLTCVLSMFNLGTGSCGGMIDVRFPTCVNLAFVEEKERAALKEAGAEFVGFMGDEPHVVPEDSEFVQKLLSVYERVEGEKGRCIAIGGGTYVHNIPGGVAFGAERGGTDYHMHGDNESAALGELLRDAALFAEVITEICG